MNYLIAVTVTSLAGKRERQLYRVPPEAPLLDVVTKAKLRSELPDFSFQVQLEILGLLEPHLYRHYVNVLDPRDVTDLVEE